MTTQPRSVWRVHPEPERVRRQMVRAAAAELAVAINRAKAEAIELSRHVAKARAADRGPGPPGTYTVLTVSACGVVVGRIHNLTLAVATAMLGRRAPNQARWVRRIDHRSMPEIGAPYHAFGRALALAALRDRARMVGGSRISSKVNGSTAMRMRGDPELVARLALKQLATV